MTQKNRGVVGPWVSDFPGTHERYQPGGIGRVAIVVDRGLFAEAKVQLPGHACANRCRCIHDAADWCDELISSSGYTLEDGPGLKKGHGAI